MIVSMPGMGPLPGAEFIACAGGGMDAFGGAERLAGVADGALLSSSSSALGFRQRLRSTGGLGPGQQFGGMQRR
ncbi:hypothetical protein FNV64_02130 [Streptomyces sp. S1A1-7]|nr:hypothetical protein FNV64_02130 [Streptomyces sp. S1A1-7]